MLVTQGRGAINFFRTAWTLFTWMILFWHLLFLCSIHGLIRGENMELGRDSDTGGQVLIASP